MQSSNANPRYRKSYVTADLIRDHPAKIRQSNKKRVYEIACPANCIHAGTIHVSRWGALPLPREFPRRSDLVLQCREDVFGYEAPPSDSIDWHLNFADPNLFFAYGGPAFAQDEIQVAEHPALASVLEGLIADGLQPLTVDGAEPTPILVSGVERRCAVATDCNSGEGRPEGIYGRQFARAKIDAIDAAVRVIAPPTTSNIIAIAAPVGGRGQYTVGEIEYVLTAAFTGFAAAKSETERLFNDGSASKRTGLHTGFWGCGAFGGHRVLMPLLQIIAARLAGIDKLIFHSITPEGTGLFGRAQTVLSGLTSEGNWLTRMLKSAPVPSDSIPLDEVVKSIQAMGFEWGVSDGN